MILNYGSINADHVYAVDHFVRPGETIASASLTTTLGGKGANQSIALARAGTTVAHAGSIGRDGEWLRNILAKESIDLRFLGTSECPSGHAVIQVSAKGENAIILFPGANFDNTPAAMDTALAAADGVVLLQNEVNDIPLLMQKAAAIERRIWFNAAPYTPAVRDYPLHLVDTLIVNETEAEGISGVSGPDAVIEGLLSRYEGLNVLLTLGADGAIYANRQGRTAVSAERVPVVDTTAAGDTFIGYFLAASESGASVSECLSRATIAAGISVGRKGASDSIPFKREVDALL
ncbi:MAG: ribokinase [Spirochaetota bacterium]